MLIGKILKKIKIFLFQFLLKINIIPISKDEIPFTDKFSLDIFLGGYDSEPINLKVPTKYTGKIEVILKLGVNIIYIIPEEGGHFIYSYFTIISNNYYPLNSPNININHKLIQKESGEQVELLLFNRVINNLKLKEALFLLNTKNHIIYNHFDNFRENFIKSNKKNYSELTKDFEGPFKQLINSVDWKNIKENKDFPISIPTKNTYNGEPYISYNRNFDRKDAIGGSNERF